MKPHKPRTAINRRPNQLLRQFGKECRVWDGGYPECMLPWSYKCKGNPFVCKKLYLKYLASSIKPDQRIIEYFENKDKRINDMKKLFRYHRSSLKDSLATTVEVTGLEDIRQKVAADENWGDYCTSLHIGSRPSHDPRLPSEWGDVYMVVGKFADGEEGCIGMCNFYEK